MYQKDCYHKPVLLAESLEGLSINPEGTYVDATFGGGGHSRALLERLGEKGKLYAFDQDKDAFSQNPIDDPRLVFIDGNFRHIRRLLRFYGVREVDGVLADFGVSSHQLDAGERGFSTRYEGPLDMRMNQEQPLSAYTVVNTYEVEALTRIFYQYGELSQGKQIAQTLCTYREEQPIETTSTLKEVVQKFLPKGKEYKVLAQIYQALRIEVNQELGALEEFLLQLPEIVKVGGRISLISYHSLEDRLVKRFIRDGQFSGEAQKDFYGNLIVPFKRVGKAITPSAEEIKENNRSRSAKLRIGERIEML